MLFEIESENVRTWKNQTKFFKPITRNAGEMCSGDLVFLSSLPYCCFWH